jgi:NitT/TauT family transport system substrate-binding protein
MGFSPWPGWMPWQIAQEKNFFAQNNLSIDLVWFDGYLDSINALVAGQLDANSQTLNDTIAPLGAGADLVVVLTNDNSTGNDQIVVREGINTIADLKGKTVAAEEGTVDHFLLLLGLQQEGLSSQDINFQPLETGKAAAAFAAGQVDAVGVFAPFSTQALKRPGSKALFTSADFPGAISDHLVFNRSFVDDHPQQVQALINSWFAALDYIHANPDESYEIMAKRAGVSVEDYKTYDAGTLIFSVEDNLTAFGTRKNMSSLPFAAEKVSQFLVDVGLTTETPDLSQLFDDRFVQAYVETLNPS